MVVGYFRLQGEDANLILITFVWSILLGLISILGISTYVVLCRLFGLSPFGRFSGFHKIIDKKLSDHEDNNSSNETERG